MRTVAAAFLVGAILVGEGEGAQPLGRDIGRKTTIQSPGAAPASRKRVSVLVRLAPGADRTRVREFARSRGGRVRYEYSILPNVVNVRDLPEAAVRQLERMEGVAAVEPDGTVETHLNQSTPLVRALKSQVEGAGFGANGANVRVCVVDTGIDSDHAMFADRIDAAAGRNFVDGTNNPEDDHGHGTHVSGIALGGDGNTINTGCAGDEPFQGIAWEATLIGVKVIDSCGIGNESDLIAGIDYCADPGASGGRADVINLSVGTDQVFANACDGDLVAQAANAAVDAGVVVVSSAGNSGEANALSSPACASKAIAVGATWDDNYGLSNCEFWFTPCWDFCLDGACLQTCSDCDPVVDQVACFSNRGSEVDVVAPGCATASADFSDPLGANWMCGTSMAAPHVSGLAALLLSRNPSLTPAQVRAAIEDGAIDVGSPGVDTASGHGRIDALESLARVACSSDGDCDDGDGCTNDVCDTVTGACVFEPPVCLAADGCCPQACVGDPDCGSSCSPAGAACTSDAECCSNRCRGKGGSKTCR